MQYFCRGGNGTFAALRLAIVGALLAVLALTSGCKIERRKTDAELGLNEQQSRGRAVYDNECIRCHEPYTRWGTHGPSLTGIYKKQFLPSGMPANDARVSDVILMGKAKMPSFRGKLTPQQLEDLLSYLKTL
ncbi:MAG TPA: cytochrome c [candidate division Zixibacteria bacterium]|nr:cytochrome c [candidate division Zixibacteria bacterium]